MIITELSVTVRGKRLSRRQGFRAATFLRRAVHGKRFLCSLVALFFSSPPLPPLIVFHLLGV